MIRNITTLVGVCAAGIFVRNALGGDDVSVDPVHIAFSSSPHASMDSPHRMAFGLAGDLFVSNGINGGAVNIYHVDTNGNAVTFGCAYPDPDAIAVDLDGEWSGQPGTVLVGYSTAGTGRIATIATDESCNNDVFGSVAGFVNPNAMAFDSTGRLVVVDSTGQGIWTSDDGAALEQLVDVEDGLPRSIAIDEHDRIYVIVDETTIRVYNADGTIAAMSLSTGLPNATSLAFGSCFPWANELHASSALGLLRIAADGTWSVVGHGLDGDSSIAFGSDGTLYVTKHLDDMIEKVSWRRTCAGDADGDGDVDVTDLLLLLASWGTCPP